MVFSQRKLTKKGKLFVQSVKMVLMPSFIIYVVYLFVFVTQKQTLVPNTIISLEYTSGLTFIMSKIDGKKRPLRTAVN